MRKGFTIIELLVTIGIIVLLATLLTVGYRHINRTIGERETQTDLNAAQSILTSYKAATYLSNTDINGKWQLVGIEDTTGNLIYKDTLNPYSKAYVNCPVGDVSSASMLSDPVVANTQKIIALMHVNPEAGKMIDGFPGKRSANGLLLDSWKQPIIFVPAGGLDNVILNGQKMLVVSKNGLPFWVSAGQDGDFVSGEDNVYSTPVDYVPAK